MPSSSSKVKAPSFHTSDDEDEDVGSEDEDVGSEDEDVGSEDEDVGSEDDDSSMDEDYVGSERGSDVSVIDVDAADEVRSNDDVGSDSGSDDIIEVDQNGNPIVHDDNQHAAHEDGFKSDGDSVDDMIVVDQKIGPLIDNDNDVGTDVDTEDRRIWDEEYDAFAEAHEEFEEDEEPPDERAMRQAHDLWRCEADLVSLSHYRKLCQS